MPNPSSTMEPAQVAHHRLATPTIKGIFVQSHVDHVRRELGVSGVERLAEVFGDSIAFNALEEIPVRDEVRLIELSLDLLDPQVPEEQRSFEAGRLHFRDFATTAWARVVFALFPWNFHYLMIHVMTIADHVFKGVRFTVQDLGPTCVKIVMENNDYPLAHFKGFFQEGMNYFGLSGTVIASETSDRRFEYLLHWK